MFCMRCVQRPAVCGTVSMWRITQYLLVLCLFGFSVINPKTVIAPKLKLNDGREIPNLALGTWLGFTPEGGRAEATGDEVQKAVEWAIDAGYRHIDTAHIYAIEDQVGKGIAKKIQDGTVKREELFVTTKLWNDRHNPDLVVPGLRESLEKLGLDYVDLYLIHWPVGESSDGTANDIDFVDTWRGMVEAKKLGLTKSIGLSNFNAEQIGRILASSEEKPAVLQVEISLNLQQPSLLEYAKQHDIKVMGYTPFGSLFPSKAKSDAPPPRVDDPALSAIADKYKKTVPQVALRYLVELGVIPIPKSVTQERIQQNIDVFNFQLSEDDRKVLQAFDKNFRTIPQIKWKEHQYYPFEK